MAFDSTAATPGSGFSFAFDTFTDTDAVERVMAYTGIAFGALGGPYSSVTSSAGLPVAQQGTWTVSVAGMAAHDAAVSGNPVLIAGYASAAAPSDVSADGDAVRLWLDRAGRVQVADGGGSLTVDGTVAATQSGTWTITTVSTVTNLATIGTSVTPGTSASHLGKAEDAAHSSGDTGVFVLAVRSDTAASTAGTDGDYAALTTDASGRLWCNVGNTVTVGSHAVTNAGTFAVQVNSALPAGTNAIGTVGATSASSATLANVSSSATNVTLASSNASRRGLLIHNDSTAVLYVKFGATATSSSYTVKMAADAYYEMPFPIYTGTVDGIWASANGAARVTEVA